MRGWTGTTCAISSPSPASGSTLAAARELRVSQTTVARRIAALEGALKLPLFEKRQAGYALTPAGEELLAQAEAGRGGGAEASPMPPSRARAT